MRKTFLVVAFSGSALMGVIVGCSSDNSTGTNNLPDRNPKGDGGETNDGSSGSNTDSGPTYNCTMHKEVDPHPACNSCTLGKCCKELTDCENDQSCLETIKCASQCADCDEFCLLGCLGTDSPTLKEFSACLKNNCDDVCTVPCDAGFDSPL